MGSDRQRVVRFAPAKINLCLHITGRREDGYHLLESLVCFADVGDVVALEIGEAARDQEPARPTLSVEGPEAGLLKAEAASDNLVLRAATLARSTLPAADHPSPLTLRFTLTKRLPVASGIGGGSSDAAAAFVLSRQALGAEEGGEPGAGLGAEDYAALLKLGADIPICLERRARWMTGVGDPAQSPVALPPLHLVLANPRVPVPTGPIFKAFSAHTQGRFRPPLEALPSRFEHFGQLIDFLAKTENDLQAPACALEPAVLTAFEALQATKGCQIARMSGSGATCFGLFQTAGDAQAAAKGLRAAHPAWWIKACGLFDPDADQ